MLLQKALADIGTLQPSSAVHLAHPLTENFKSFLGDILWLSLHPEAQEKATSHNPNLAKLTHPLNIDIPLTVPHFRQFFAQGIITQTPYSNETYRNSFKEIYALLKQEIPKLQGEQTPISRLLIGAMMLDLGSLLIFSI